MSRLLYENIVFLDEIVRCCTDFVDDGFVERSKVRVFWIDRSEKDRRRVVADGARNDGTVLNVGIVHAEGGE